MDTLTPTAINYIWTCVESLGETRWVCDYASVVVKDKSVLIYKWFTVGKNRYDFVKRVRCDELTAMGMAERLTKADMIPA